MKVKRYIVPLICAVLLFGSCVKEFDAPSAGFENLLTVEAFLSDGDEPFEVLLSWSVPIDTFGFIPESGAFVSLKETSGEVYELKETTAGRYLFDGQINPKPGDKYTLRIQTSSGRRYESDEVTMRDTPEIDEVRWAFEEKSTGEKGVQFYLNTHDETNQTKYYRWEWDETWIIRTPYQSYLIYEGGILNRREEDIQTCWKFYKSSAIDIGSSQNLSNDIISDYPLRYVTINSDRLQRRYSIRVKQYSLSEKSYTFWKELQKITENLGTLFDPQPSVLRGNIHSIENEDEVILGYFDAAVEKETRVFVDHRDFPLVQFPNIFGYCLDSAVTYGQIGKMIQDGYFLVGETVLSTGTGYLMSFPSCVDCRFYGTNQKPDYWY